MIVMLCYHIVSICDYIMFKVMYKVVLACSKSPSLPYMADYMVITCMLYHSFGPYGRRNDIYVYIYIYIERERS